MNMEITSSEEECNKNVPPPGSFYITFKQFATEA